MENQARVVSIIALLALGMGLSGCANDQIDRYQQINQTSAGRIEQLNQEAKTLHTTVARKQARIEELQGEVSQLQGIRGGLENQITGIRTRQASLASALGNLQLGTLDPETDRALQSLAASHTDIIRYDSARGMITFTSDLTFGSGSDETKPAAVEGLRKLAGIMLTSAATNYDLRIVGHTDSQRMSNPATIRKFGTNRHLSFYRAAAVEKALRTAGIPGERLETVGWGEYRPVMPNNPRGGTAANRRVEIYVVTSTSNRPTGAIEATAPIDAKPEPAPAPKRRFPMK